MKLGVILGTTRQGRQSEKIAKWVVSTAKEQEGIDVALVDLADYDLPIFEEPVSPRYNPDRKPVEIAQKWMDKLATFDAYVFVTPEYNHSIPGVLKNAFDYLDFQLNRKPAAIVSHGTVGGARAAMHLKEIISEAKAVPIQNFVAIVSPVSSVLSEEGILAEEIAAAQYGPHTALENLLGELKWYSDALAAARTATA